MDMPRKRRRAGRRSSVHRSAGFRQDRKQTGREDGDRYRSDTTAAGSHFWKVIQVSPVYNKAFASGKSKTIAVTAFIDERAEVERVLSMKARGDIYAGVDRRNSRGG